jgi:hypothetical protein
MKFDRFNQGSRLLIQPVNKTMILLVCWRSSLVLSKRAGSIDTTLLFLTTQWSICTESVFRPSRHSMEHSWAQWAFGSCFSCSTPNSVAWIESQQRIDLEHIGLLIEERAFVPCSHPRRTTLLPTTQPSIFYTTWNLSSSWSSLLFIADTKYFVQWIVCLLNFSTKYAICSWLLVSFSQKQPTFLRETPVQILHNQSTQ